MKKLFIILILLTFAAVSFADSSPTISSGEKTADSLIHTGSGYFSQIVIMPDGTNTVTVSFYDNTAASGTEILPTLTFAGDGGPQASPTTLVHVTNGIYVDITTAGTVAYTILYRERK